jgi:hypothetical protein
MKNALKLFAVFLLLIWGCDFGDGSSFEILVENKHPDSKYRVVLEDYTYYVWASLYVDDTSSPICNCFLWTIKEPLKENDMPAPFNGNPPISVKYASDDAFIERMFRGSIEFRWSDDGKIVLILAKNSPICLLDGVRQKSYTKAVKQAGPYGLKWNDTKFLNEFSGKI